MNPASQDPHASSSESPLPAAMREGAPAGSPLPLIESGHTEYKTSEADRMVRFPQLLFDPKFWYLALVLVKFAVGATIAIFLPRKNAEQAELAREKAQYVRQLLFDLGPTFIKLGQFLSVRRDMLPLEMAEELALLQDKVPPFELEMVRQTILQDLGATPEELFSEFDPVPIASASIGQVHKVRLKEGGFAVIKVQRPALAKQFYRDLGLMRLIGRWWIAYTKLQVNTGITIQTLFRKPQTQTATSGGTQQVHGIAQQTHLARHRPLDVQGWLELSDEFGRVLFSEIDYIQEGRNADRLRKSVRSKPEIRIPRVHWRYTGRHVLMLEYLPGIKISQVKELKAKGFDLEKIGNMLVNCYLEQFVLTGFFHADPHAGNLAIDSSGRLIIYDFGMMGEISEQHRQALLASIMAVVRRNSDMVTSSLQELGIVSSTAPAEVVSRAISPFIDYYAGQDIMELDFRNLEADIDRVIAERSFRLPANLAYLLRAGSSLEGIARTLKPDFSFVAAVRPVMTRWALKQGIESLAKNGKLLTFAHFAFNEIRALVKQQSAESADGMADNGSSTTGSKNRPVELHSTQAQESKIISNSSAKRISLQAANSNDSSKPALSGRVSADGSISASVNRVNTAFKDCSRCLQHSKDIRIMHKKLRAAVSFMWVYLVISAAMMIFLVFWSSAGSWLLTLSFSIGMTGLGALIICKFTELAKWSAQHAAGESKYQAQARKKDFTDSDQ